MTDRGVLASVACTALGLWLYIAPGVLAYDTPQSASDRISGALILAFSFVAIWEFLRGLRFASRVIAVWVLISVPIFQPPLDAAVSTLLAAAAVLALSFVRGEIGRPYGGGWRALLDRESG
ncbi:MAG TPA: hypothetical protein VGR12_04755 [Solirubrobacteraceae bacterium]|nr:hypothetical protein [Solirubrobacteraceae bacterium]